MGQIVVINGVRVKGQIQFTHIYLDPTLFWSRGCPDSHWFGLNLLNMSIYIDTIDTFG
jgi:hypothetical protein